MTGGTGFLGFYLSKKLLKAGHRVIFIGRSKGDLSLKHRIVQQLDFVSSDTIECIEHDFDKSDSNQLIVSLSNIVERVDGIWHLAADLSFKYKNKERIFATNIGGMKHVIDVAGHFKCPLFYMSTAYVHGRVSGTVDESYKDRPTVFNNPYEESKFEAELLIREAQHIKSVVFRPSILVDSHVEYPSNFGYYSFLIALSQFRSSLTSFFKDRRLFLPVPLVYARCMSLNLMPVDTAVDWMYRISQDIQSIGSIFHICNPKPFPLGSLFRQTLHAYGIFIPVIAVPRILANFYISLVVFISHILKPIKPIARRLAYFKGYLLEDVVYDMTNTRNFIGSNIETSFDFPSDYIGKLARLFRDKMKVSEK